MQAFLGLNIAMGMLCLQQMRDYWSTPWFPNVMSRECFILILRYLHLVASTQHKRGNRVSYPIQGEAIDQSSSCCFIYILQTYVAVSSALMNDDWHLHIIFTVHFPKNLVLASKCGWIPKPNRLRAQFSSLHWCRRCSNKEIFWVSGIVTVWTGQRTLHFCR